jgi:hypothetical protein
VRTRVYRRAVSLATKAALYYRAEISKLRTSPMPRFLDTDRRIAVALFLLVSSVYFATMVGVTSSNDGSHYALVRALVERRSFEISPYMDFTEHQDYAMKGDLRFSDRPPGTALAAAPLYALSWIAPAPLMQPPSKHDAANPHMLFAVLLSPLAAALAVSLFYVTLRESLERSRFGALLAAIALAFGTTTWKYGSVLYSHGLGSLVIWASIYLVLRSWKKPLRWQGILLLGVLLGYAALVEYTNVVTSAVIGIAWLAGTQPFRRWHDPEWRVSLVTVVIGGLIPLAFLLLYNTLNFGSPFELSTFNVDTVRWPQNEGMAADFATPLGDGLMGLLVYGSDNQGIFLLSPITLLAIPGIWRMIRSVPRRSGLILGLFTIMLLLFAKSTTFNAATNDGRYLTPFIGLWLVPLAFWIDATYVEQRRELLRLLATLLLFGLLFLSIRNQMMHIALSWNYDFDPRLLNHMAASPENIGYFLATLFPNAGNLPLLWLGEAIVLGITMLMSRRREVTTSTLASSPEALR